MYSFRADDKRRRLSSGNMTINKILIANNSTFIDYHSRQFTKMSKILTVFGATGKQGGSVIRTILQDAKLSQEFKIRGITRDTTKPGAQALSKQGVELRSVRFTCPSGQTLETY